MAAIKNAFTLIELLVVVVIIAVLAALSTVAWQRTLAHFPSGS